MCQGVLERPLTAPRLHFKGAGWYVNDYAAKGSTPAAEPSGTAAPAKAETPAAPKESTSASTSSGSTSGGSTPAPSAPPTTATS